MKRKKDLYKIAEKLAKFLGKNYKVKRIFLLGSVIEGKMHPYSDIDIVIEGLPPRDYISALTKAYDILPKGVELNLIPFENAFSSLKEKVLKEGKLIYG
jgi:predicted nucleotidyltransferase